MFKTFRKSSKSVVGVVHNATIVVDVIVVFYQLRSQTLRAPLRPDTRQHAELYLHKVCVSLTNLAFPRHI